MIEPTPQTAGTLQQELPTYSTADTPTMIQEEPHSPSDNICINNDDTPPTIIEEVEAEQQQTRHTQSKNDRYLLSQTIT